MNTENIRTNTASKKGHLLDVINQGGRRLGQNAGRGNYFDAPEYDDLGHVLQNVMQNDYSDVNDNQYYNKQYENTFPEYENKPKYRARNRHDYGNSNQRIQKKAGIDNMRRKRVTNSLFIDKNTENKSIYRNTKFKRNTKNNRDDINIDTKNKINYSKQSKKQNVKRKLLNRKRRHIGPHDEDGLQRLLSTGTLAPTTLPPDHPNYNHSIDVVFATYWFFPAKTQTILPKDQKCIDKKLSQEKTRFSPSSKYNLYVIIVKSLQMFFIILIGFFSYSSSITYTLIK